MALISLKFMMFFAFVLAGWFLLPARGQKLFLLAACWVFYALQSGGLLVLLLLSTLVSYLAALAMEPNLSDSVVAALYAPSAGIVCPFLMNIAMAENAFENGVDFRFNTEVEALRRAASEKGLLISGGSDYHGTGKPHLHLGMLNKEDVIIDRTQLTVLEA